MPLERRSVMARAAARPRVQLGEEAKYALLELWIRERLGHVSCSLWRGFGVEHNLEARMALR